MAVRTRGTTGIRRLRARRRITSENQQIIVPYVGLYAQLEAAMPQIDSALPGFPGDYKVAVVDLEEGRSVEGRMVVTLEAPQPGNTGSSSNQQIGETIYELDWGEERRLLEEHRNMPRLKADRPYYEYPDRKTSTSNPGKNDGEAASAADKQYRQRTWDNWETLDGSDVEGGTWSLANYKQLREKGYTDYPVSFPIARRTIYARFRIPPTGGVYTISSPPAQCGAPGGWTYVKTASRSSKQGKLYTLIEEWRGYNRADSLFFL